jgi:hypothetical protein
LREVRLDLLKEDVIFQQAVQSGQRGFFLQGKLGDQGEQIHRIVAIAQHLGVSLPRVEF